MQESSYMRTLRIQAWFDREIPTLKWSMYIQPFISEAVSELVDNSGNIWSSKCEHLHNIYIFIVPERDELDMLK